MIAQDADIRLVPHAFKTGLRLATCLHLIAALPNSVLLEYALADSPLRKHLLIEPFGPASGYVKVPDRPGLGIEVNPDVVARNRVI
jgi:L-alanine-DL-glutamate epimerase-like enolase superfamily enzyme